MQFLPGHTYHVYNQGNNRDPIFFEREDYVLFARKMKIALLPHCSILAWCLMPNHFHWLVHVNDDYKVLFDPDERSRNLNPLNKDVGTLLSSYTQTFNKKQNRSGSLFRKRTKAKSLSEGGYSRNDYGINCFLYIHQNPLKAGLVNKMEDWEYSSYRDFVGLRSGTLCDKELALKLLNLPKNPFDFYQLSLKTVSDQILEKLF